MGRLRLFHFRRGGRSGEGRYLPGFAVFRVGCLELTVTSRWINWPARSRWDWRAGVLRWGWFVLSWWEPK